MADKKTWIWPGAVVLVFVSALLSLCLGAAKLPLPALWQAIISGPTGTAGYIFWYSRLPRTMPGRIWSWICRPMRSIWAARRN